MQLAYLSLLASPDATNIASGFIFTKLFKNKVLKFYFSKN